MLYACFTDRQLMEIVLRVISCMALGCICIAVAAEPRLRGVIPNIVPITQRIFWFSVFAGFFVWLLRSPNIFVAIPWIAFGYCLALVGLLIYKIYAMKRGSNIDGYLEFKSFRHTLLYDCFQHYVIIHTMIISGQIGIVNAFS